MNQVSSREHSTVLMAVWVHSNTYINKRRSIDRLLCGVIMETIRWLSITPIQYYRFLNALNDEGIKSKCSSTAPLTLYTLAGFSSIW